MTDDIVTRLRAWTIAFTWDWSLPNDAADEIERLRHQIESLQKALDEALRLGAEGAIVTKKWNIK